MSWQQQQQQQQHQQYQPPQTDDYVGTVKLSNNYTIRDSYGDQPKPEEKLIQDPNDPTKFYKVWNQGGPTGFRPVIFKPNASFAALKAQRKLSLSPEEEEAERQARGDVPDYARRKHFMPGYTGYIRGKQHIKGRTFGEATNRALERDYRELACTSPIPSDPAHNRKIPMARPSNTFVGAQKIGETMTHVPGYSGYIPRSRDAFGVTFGAISSAQLRSVNSTQDREIRDMEIEGRSRPLFRREMMKLDSAPLPGGIQTWNAPQKLVPAHLQHVRYLPY